MSPDSGAATVVWPGMAVTVAPASPTPRSLFYRHIELFPHAMLSEVAALTPFSDLNQSPRNMYQCQMGKQTMATPIHTWHLNSGTSSIRLGKAGPD